MPRPQRFTIIFSPSISNENSAPFLVEDVATVAIVVIIQGGAIVLVVENSINVTIAVDRITHLIVVGRRET